MEARKQLGVVVLATDFSDTARLAQRHAAALAKRGGARLVLVHGHTMAAHWIGPANPLTVPPSIEEVIRRSAHAELEKDAAELRAEGLEVEERLVAGPGPEAVLQVAEDVGADLIVTGTRGHSGLKHLFLGSIAEQIVRHAPVPVLSIHPEDEQLPGAALDIVLPTDFSDDARRAVDDTIRLLGEDPEQSRLTLVHVVHAPILMSPVIGDFDMQYVFLEEARGHAAKALDELADELRELGFAVEAVVRDGDPADAIAEVARERNASLIAMGTRGLHGLKRLVQGSVADRTVRHAGCPVLTVPRAHEED